MKKAILTVFLAIVALLALFVVSCKKDSIEEPNSNQTTLSISVEEVRQILGDPSSGMVSSRSHIKVPLNFTPNWDNAILNTQTGAPIVVAEVDTCCLPPDMPAKGNLIFKKNNTGTIECSLMLWFKSPGSAYDDWRAPLWTQNTFSGLVVLVDAQDTIRRVASYANGSIHKVLVWNKNIRDLAEDEFGTSPTVEDRYPGFGCFNGWGKSIWEKIGENLLEVLDGLGAFFIGDGSNNGNNTGQQDPFSFFFDFSNTTNTWTWHGGGGGSPSEFENYRVDCGIALQNFIANGFYLPEYAHMDMRLCELLSELYVFDNSGAANTRLLCLYTNHQSTYFEEIWQYWEHSSKDQDARNVLNNFLDAACGENPSVQKVEMLRNAYCLGDMNLVDLWNRLTAECGPNFGLEISPCLAEIILSNANTSNGYQCNGALGNIINFARQHNLTAQQFLVLVQNEALFNLIFNFILSKGESIASIAFASDIINQIAQHNLVFLTGDDLNFLFGYMDAYIKFKKYLEDNPNITEAEKISALYLLRAFYPAPPDGLPIQDIKASLDNCFGTSCTNCTYSATLLIEQPMPGTREIYAITTGSGGSGGTIGYNTGHTFLELSQTNLSGITTTKGIGFYPLAYPSGNNEVKGYFFNEDANTTYNIKVTFDLNQGQFTDIRNTLDDIYWLFAAGYNNCTTSVVTALNSAGLNIPLTPKWHWPVGNILGNPADLGEDLRANSHGGQFTSTSTPQNFSPSSCQ